MNDTQVQENTSLMALAAQSGAQKTGEFFVDKALNAIVDGVKKMYGGAQVLLGAAFTRYLKNATRHYNQVHTIATGDITRSIIGPDNIYVSIGVQYRDKKISTDTVDQMLSIGENLLIQGTGGIGKSMMMRYLFLNTAHRGEYVPVLLELRKISRQTMGEISIMDLIFTCLKDFDVELPREQFEFSLRLGKYVFFMDGFDEVKESMAAETAEKIQLFCSKYPNNPCIITSRPGRDTSPLQTFTTIKSLPLSKEQAIALANKIWDEDEKTKEFCRQLRDELYDNEQHREFVENPLLLSMMFLTFMRNNSLPNHLAEFYRQAFDALYSTHDSKNKGAYRREFECDKLDESGFRRILSHFCFQSYFKQDYGFSEEELMLYLGKSINKFGYSEISARSYFLDLKNVVCLIVRDGEKYKFAHRSFQTYFAARYTAEELNDEQQKKVLQEFVRTGMRGADSDYLILLYQLEHERMVVNLLEKTIRQYLDDFQTTPNPVRSYLKSILPDSFHLSKDKNNKKIILGGFVWAPDGRNIHFLEYHKLFCIYVMKKTRVAYHHRILMMIKAAFEERSVEKLAIEFQENKFIEIKLDKMIQLGVSETEMERFYEEVERKLEIAETISQMCLWLASVDSKKRMLEQRSFIEDL